MDGEANFTVKSFSKYYIPEIFFLKLKDVTNIRGKTTGGSTNENQMYATYFSVNSIVLDRRKRRRGKASRKIETKITTLQNENDVKTKPSDNLKN